MIYWKNASHYCSCGCVVFPINSYIFIFIQTNLLLRTLDEFNRHVFCHLCLVKLMHVLQTSKIGTYERQLPVSTSCETSSGNRACVILFWLANSRQNSRHWALQVPANTPGQCTTTALSRSANSWYVTSIAKYVRSFILAKKGFILAIYVYILFKCP